MSVDYIVFELTCSSRRREHKINFNFFSIGNFTFYYTKETIQPFRLRYNTTEKTHRVSQSTGKLKKFNIQIRVELHLKKGVEGDERVEK